MTPLWACPLSAQLPRPPGCSPYISKSFQASELACPSSTHLSLFSISAQMSFVQRPTSLPRPECPLCPPPHASPATVLSSFHLPVSETICLTYSFFCLSFQTRIYPSRNHQQGWPCPLLGLAPTSKHCVRALCRCPAWVTLCPRRLARAEQAGRRGQGSPARLDS